MGERKVLNKYYPPDFDPALIPRMKQDKNAQIKVRIMLPMSIQCNQCAEFIYQGKKFNARKETVHGEDYLGIKIFRFYLKCTRCSAEITIKTDPKNSDYVAETGAQRNFEPWKQTEDDQAEAEAKREKEEEGDAMKALENRTLESKREMDIIDALSEIRDINTRHAKVDHDAVIDKLREKDKIEEVTDDLEEEDEKLVEETFGESGKGAFLKRLDSSEDDGLKQQEEDIWTITKKSKETEQKKDDSPVAVQFVVAEKKNKKRKKEKKGDKKSKKKKKEGTNALAGIAAYGSASEEEQ
eukprot:GFYU01007674.1.p1 GENE.GFYU01007674.1~~GFYU01007674.1.p1  ORF type:complete len:297 (-),score=59.62 GFYU01007674.1:434-1324(-)